MSSIRLNDFFEQILVINLDRRPDRLQQVTAELSKYDIQASRVSAVDGTTLLPGKSIGRRGQIGCTLSHLQVLEYARDNKLKNILILEDDVEFHRELIERFSIAASELPADWDMFYLGGNHLVRPDSIATFSKHLCRINHVLTTHAYGVNAKAYGALIEKLSEIYPVVDALYVQIQSKLNCYKIHPNIAWQAVSYSDIENQVMNTYFMKTDK